MRAIFLVLDTVRRDFLTAYGNAWVQTPNLTRLAKGGVTFDNHWVGSLPCMPARREFMTGRYNFMYRGWGPIEPFDDTLPGELRKKGVFTHLVTDHMHYFELGGENYHTAFNTWDFIRGAEHDGWISLVDRMGLPEHMGKLSDQNWKNRQKQTREEDHPGPRTCRAACEWLRANRNADNWFLQVELFEPHEPFFCDEKYLKLYGDTWQGPLYDWPAYEKVKDSPEAIEHIRKCYAGLLTMTDHWLGTIFATLDELGLYDDTLILFTTDHGTLLAEHGYWMKNYMPLYNEICRIPLIAKVPGAPQLAGTRVTDLTQTIDVMPSILDFFGCEPPPHVHGQPVRPIFFGQPIHQDVIFGYFGKSTNITDGRYVYFRNPVNPDAGPLHAYTAMPTGGMKRWYGRELNERMEMGRYFGHTYNMPLYKIPQTGQLPEPAEGAPSLLGRHQLFDIIADPRQEHELDDAVREAHLAGRIREHLKNCEAPVEQFVRLGL